MDKASYQEPLSSGGKLVVDKDGWAIQYYFRGPDLRYNGEFITVFSHQIDDYIAAFELNFETYAKLKTTIPSNGNFETKGLCNMFIRIGYGEGVDLSHSFNHCNESVFPICNKAQLDMAIFDYKYSRERAQEITNLLFAKK